MHGQGRAEYKARQRDPKVVAKLSQKAQQWRQLTAELPNASSAVAWELTETLLRVNPDPLYIWNQRRELFLEKCQTNNDRDNDEEDKESLLEKELSLTAAALQANPKAYGAWFHRKWVLMKACLTLTKNTKNLLRQELGLTELFLQRDERNFHCWNYRRFVVSFQINPSPDGSWGTWLVDDDEEAKRIVVMGAQVVPADGAANKETKKTETFKETAAHMLQAEWEFTRTKIVHNFSNFSAFHYRSKLLQLLWPRVDLADELQLVEDAVYPEPDDQTAWWYQAFLLDWMKTKAATDTDRMQQHLEALEELANEVTTCKWVRLGMLSCLERLPGDTKEKQRELWQNLLEMDQDRKARYQHMLAKLEDA